MRLKITSAATNKPSYFEIHVTTGIVDVDTSTDAKRIPKCVKDKKVLRLSIPACMSRDDIIEFFRENEGSFSDVVFGHSYDPINRVGILTDLAESVLSDLQAQLDCIAE